MQHRHFATVATIIKSLEDPSISKRDRHTLARHFADELAGTNPRFDRQRFLAACGL